MKNSVERKLRELQALARDPDQEVIDALSSIDQESISGNALVRATLEDKELSTLNTFIATFSGLAAHMDKMFTAINTLDDACTSMLEKLSLGDKGVDEVLDMTSSLHTQQAKQRQQLARIHAFIDEYYMSKGDMEMLANGDIGDAFFDVFGKLETAQERTASAMRMNQTQCLLDVSASLTKMKEAAYQRMYHWLHLSAHMFDGSRPSVGSTYEKCLKAVKAKPFLYSFVVDEVAKVRGDVVGRTFLKVLTAGDGDTKPLEASAGVDPLQYAGDLFAWTHQISATEAAFLAGLLKDEQTSKVVKGAMSIVLGSIVRPLEIRVSQAIKGLVRPPDLYQVVNVCAFFESTFGGICGLTSPICQCCGTMKTTATESFRASINDSLDGVRSTGKPTQGAINEAIRAVMEITALHRQSSLSESFDVGSLIDNYATGLRSAIHECTESVMFQANALYELLNVCTEANLQSRNAVSDEVSDLMRQIVSTELDDIFRRCRMTEVLILAESKNDRPMSTVRGMEPDVIVAVIKRFETVLLSSGPVVTPLCDLLQNQELRQKARIALADKLSATYELLYNIVMDPINGYDSTGTMFRHVPSLVREMIMV